MSDSCDSIEMENDHCGFINVWNKDTQFLQLSVYGWAYLPSILLHDIFKRLSPEDRLKASSVCRTWRQALYHPSFWRETCFTITSSELMRNEYLSSACGSLVRSAIIRFNSLSELCVYELANLLQRMTENLNIRSLIFEPSHCHLCLPQKNNMFFERCILEPLMQINSNLETLSLGCCENLCHYVKRILQFELRCPENVKLLGLASVKEDPGSYMVVNCDPSIFQPFINLQVLSIDYDYVSDKFLESLRGATQLSRLVIHIHELWEDGQGTTNAAWEQFVTVHPHCQLRLTLIHAYRTVMFLHSQILHPAMPLTHLKVFFCESLNMRVLGLLSSWYAHTFRSIMWVDSQSQSRSYWTLVHSIAENNDANPDPLVMAAWLCPKLEEIVLLGYKYFAEDLVGVARLCENKLQRLEIANEDIIYAQETYHGLTDPTEEISKVLGRTWAPLQNQDLHPVITNPNAGDSDEYLLPIVLSDLY